MSEADVLLGVIDENSLKLMSDSHLAILEKWMIIAMEDDHSNKAEAYSTLCMVWNEQYDRKPKMTEEEAIENYLMEREEI